MIFAKQLVINNFGAAASSHANAPGYAPDPLRDATAILQVQAQVGAAAANYEPDVENAEILRAIQAAADYSWNNGIAMFYDIFATGAVPQFEFRTATVAYNNDLTAGPNAITLHEELDLAEFEIGFDWDGTANRVYGGARGAQGAARIYAISPIVGSADDVQLNATVAADPFALRESFESSAADDLAGTQSDAAAARTAAGTVFTATGQTNPAGRYAYGRDYTFGDLVNCVVWSDRISGVHHQ